MGMSLVYLLCLRTLVQFCKADWRPGISFSELHEATFSIQQLGTSTLHGEAFECTYVQHAEWKILVGTNIHTYFKPTHHQNIDLTDIAMH